MLNDLGGFVVLKNILYNEVDGHSVKLLNAKQLEGGEVLDLAEDIPPNYLFLAKDPVTTR